MYFEVIEQMCHIATTAFLIFFIALSVQGLKGAIGAASVFKKINKISYAFCNVLSMLLKNKELWVTKVPVT